MARRKQTSIPALFSLSAVQPPHRGPVPEACVPAPQALVPVDRPDRDLLGSWALGRTRRVTDGAVGGLRFAFYWRCSTEDHQDPVTSRAWQLGQALATVGGEGRIVVEFSDVGKSRSMSPLLRPGSAALLAALADPNRGFDAVVIGSNERAFSGNQYSLVAPLLASHGVQLWMPELGGRVDPSIDTVEELMDLLGILARREVLRAQARVTNAVTVQVLEQGRYEGGRSRTATCWSMPARTPTGAKTGAACGCTRSASMRPRPRPSNGSSRCDWRSSASPGSPGP